MGKKIYLICLVSGLLLISIYGCTYTASFNRLPYVSMEAAKQYSAMQKAKTAEQILFLKEYPKESYVVLGTLHAPEIEWTAHYDTDDLIKAMRKKAVEIGADAIVDFRFKENPTVHTVGGVSISGSRAYGSFSAVPYKGLHAWGEAIIFIPEDKKKLIESK
ncbi:MAG: hypothetical protein AABY52_06250 [Deltaproteobacteria bacterium]